MAETGFSLAVPVSDVDHQLGAGEAGVVVVEYVDFECPNCKQAAPAVKLLLEHFTGTVRYVLRHFPLEEVHPHALYAALASEAASAQGKFWEMHDALFAHQSDLTLAALRGYAEALDMDMDRFDSDMGQRRFLPAIRAQMEGGRRSGVRATPTFFVNGSIQDVSFGMQVLFRTVEALSSR